MKKAQMQQTFTYIMAILIIGAVLLLGLRSILGIMNQACDVNEVSFKQEIERALNKYTRIGSLGYETIKVPCDYDKLCFMNTTECEQISDDDVMETECQAETGNNVFITRKNITQPLFAIDNLQVDATFCVEPRGNNYHIKIEGIGRSIVKVSEDVIETSSTQQTTSAS